MREATRRRVESLKTIAERKKQSAGVETWSIDELVVLYRYATDRERLFLLLGLNGGFAQSECIHLQRHEVKLTDSPPIVDHHRQHRRDDLPLAVVSEHGTPLDRNSIANPWNRLLNRIRVDHPGFTVLPFKFLRKTSRAVPVEKPWPRSTAGETHPR